MKKITLFALILVAFVAVLWSCTKEEVSIEKQNAKTNELAQQLAKDEDFVKLQELGRTHSQNFIQTYLSLTKKDRANLKADFAKMRNGKVYDEFEMRDLANFRKTIGSKECTEQVIQLMARLRAKYTNFASLTRENKLLLFHKARLLLNSNAKARVEDCGSDQATCTNDAWDFFGDAIDECKQAVPPSGNLYDPEANKCVKNAEMGKESKLEGCAEDFANCQP